MAEMLEDDPAFGKKQEQRATVPKEFLYPKPFPAAVLIPPYPGSQLITTQGLEFRVTSQPPWGQSFVPVCSVEVQEAAPLPRAVSTLC